MKPIKQINSEYEKACNEYIEMFCKKQDLEFDYWIGGVCEVAGFISQYYFNLSDIIHDLNTKQKKGLILQWQDDGIDAHFRGIDENINYKSYCMGARYK
jgi:hypothetical protein